MPLKSLGTNSFIVPRFRTPGNASLSGYTWAVKVTPPGEDEAVYVIVRYAVGLMFEGQEATRVHRRSYTRLIVECNTGENHLRFSTSS